MVVEGRQILIMVIVIVVFFLISMLSVVGIYFYKPSILGFPENTESDTTEAEFDFHDLPVTETINISKDRIDYFERMIKEKKKLENEKDSLLNNTKMLRDSLKDVYTDKLTSDSLKNEAEILLRDTLNTIKVLTDSIFTLNIDLKKSENRLEDLNETIKNQEEYIIQEADSLEEVNYAQFAKIYNNTNPVEVAKILEQIDERDAAKILKQMSNKQAGKVLEAMTPESAAAILLLGAGK